MSLPFALPWYALDLAADRVPILARMTPGEGAHFARGRGDCPESTIAADHVLDAVAGDPRAAEELLRAAAKEQRAPEDSDA